MSSTQVIIYWILYADDTCLFSKSVTDCKKLLEFLHHACGLGKGGKASFFSVTDTPITNVSAFTYLGHDISNIYEKRCTDLLVSHATGEFFELYRVLANKWLKKKTRRKLLESCVSSRLIYATQAILPKSREMTKI